jgi:hypothetical protein
VTFLWCGCRIGWNRLQLEALVHERLRKLRAGVTAGGGV